MLQNDLAKREQVEVRVVKFWSGEDEFPVGVWGVLMVPPDGVATLGMVFMEPDDVSSFNNMEHGFWFGSGMSGE